jgi:AcrR family transcriptional regulator
MARTQAADYDQKRELITDAAAKLFARRGFASASLSDIASACNMSKSLIYHYYESKEAILYDVMNSHIDLLIGAIEETDKSNAAPDEKFKKLSRALMRRYIGAADSQKVLLYELDSLPQLQRNEIISKQRSIIDYAEGLLSKASNNSIDHGHLRAQVMLFFGQINWTHNWFKASGSVSRDDIADMAATATLRAVMS